jgi:CSLREA domain-containing protein/uncharacterized repeat protein (TIGR01451 family)
MALRSLLHALASPRLSRLRRSRHNTPRLEALESRLLLSTLVVNSTGDKRDAVLGSFPRCNTGDTLPDGSEECTLRAAIQEANATPELDTIEFDIPITAEGYNQTTKVFTIKPGVSIEKFPTGFLTTFEITIGLPEITSPVIINGYSQFEAKPNTNPYDAGTNAVLKIELDGSAVPLPYRDTGLGTPSSPGGVNGLVLRGGNSTVRGLIINGFPADITGVTNGMGIVLDGPGNNVVEGNFIGTDSTGTVARPNAGVGVLIAAATSTNWIGCNDRSSEWTRCSDSLGNPMAARNLISGNRGFGISLSVQSTAPSGHRIQGNLIGTKANGTDKLANGVGIYIGSPGNFVGGGDGADGVDDNRVIARNIISGNDFYGIEIDRFKTLGNPASNLVRGNFIGTNVTGQRDPNHDLGNGFSGVYLGDGAGNNTIGGVGKLEGNVISGNHQHGIQIYKGATANVVQGNLIGTDYFGTSAILNTFSGVSIDNSPNNTIGGETNSTANVISGNGLSGITVSGTGSHDNSILFNLIGVAYIGTDALPNELDGIRIDGAVGTVIGSSAAGAPAVVISGNKKHGIFITGSQATGNKIVHSVIGLDPAQAIAGTNTVATKIPNGSHGIEIAAGAHENAIGFSSAQLLNVISGNSGWGVVVTGTGTNGNVIRGTNIGADASGTRAMGNSKGGIEVTDHASGTIIGGLRISSAKPVNLISSNSENGIDLLEAGEGTRIQGNFIGTDIAGDCTLNSDGKCPLGNHQHAIRIRSTNRALIGNSVLGASASLAGNVIAFNGGDLGLRGHGIEIESGVGNTIRMNSIFDNAGRGIDLAKPVGADYSFGINDSDDHDDGPNRLTNYPVVTKLQFIGSMRLVTWTVYTDPLLAGQPFTVEVFANNAPDPSGFGEGKDLVFTGTVSPQTTSDGTIGRMTMVMDNTRQFLSATVTDPAGNTSEFSMVDSDADAIADTWETKGIDVNEDGEIDFDLNKWNGHPNATAADPQWKDVFVEIDAMRDREPSSDVLNEVVAAFSSAPAALVQNPNGEGGILLHLNLDQTNLKREPWTFATPGDFPPAFFVAKDKYFGWAHEPPLALLAERLVFRYAIFADSVPGVNGQGELNGNDFYVSLRRSNPAIFQAAGDLMHELGHTLGLDHGGIDPTTETADDKNCKPNYHSVMNYLWTYPNRFSDNSDYGRSWRLDYSRRAFNTIDETAIREADGLGGDAGNFVPVGPFAIVLGDPLHDYYVDIVSESGPIDLNQDGNTTDTVGQQISRLSFDCFDGNPTTLNPSEDWSHLKYYFVASGHFANSTPPTIPIEADLPPEAFEALGAAGREPGSLAFSPEFEYEPVESDGFVTIRVTRNGGAEGTVTVNYATSDGTAASGQDYSGVSGTLTFLPAEFVKTFEIPIVADPSDEEDETFFVTLSNATGGATLAETQKAVTIIDDDGPGVFQFREELFYASEHSGQATITVVRSRGTDGIVSVNVATHDLTATADDDYIATSGTLNFADGETTKTFTIPLRDDSAFERDEDIELVLSSPTGGAIVDDSHAGQLRITDDDPAGVFSFGLPAFDADEAAGSATIVVNYSGGAFEPVTIEFSSIDDSATAGSDYVAVQGSLTFAPGELTKTFSVPLTNDTRLEGTETLQLRLLNPSTGSTVGALGTAELRIADDEAISAATFIVSNTLDGGPGSLRQAILDANARPGPDFIHFDIAGAGVHTIRPVSSLPAITGPVLLDAYTQPGSQRNTLAQGDNAVLLIELDGTSATQSGLVITGSESTVRGLAINRFPEFGIVLAGGGGNEIQGNFIGPDATGTARVEFGPGFVGHAGGIQVHDSTNNVIGGTASATRNIISANGGQGIRIEISDVDRPLHGCLVDQAVPMTTCNRVQGNTIGLAADGISPLGNGTGISIFGASDNTIGGVASGEANVIAFNVGSGIEIQQNGRFNPNGSPIFMGATGNAIRGNSIKSNSRVLTIAPGINKLVAGIDLSDNSRLNGLSNPIAVNDLGDGDFGPNGVQNYPVLESALHVDGQLAIRGRLDSGRRAQFELDFFASSQMDPSGYGEGEVYVGSATVQTDSNGHAEFTSILAASVPDSWFITATATDAANSTSEFSARILLGDVLDSDTFIVNTSDDLDDGACSISHCSLREALHSSNNHPGPDFIGFDIPGNGVRTIYPRLNLPPISDPVTIDGYSQPGAHPNSLELGDNAVLLIEISGLNLATHEGSQSLRTGLNIAAGNSTVRGMVFDRIDYGIFVQQEGGNLIEGNFFGVDASGASVPTSLASTSAKLTLASSNGNTIGGATPEARNVLMGIELDSADRNVIQGNYVGTRANGINVPLGNHGMGVAITGSSNLIGGMTPQERNVIGGNFTGVDIAGSSNQVLGNYIGVGADGISPFFNQFWGVFIAPGSSNNAIGSIEPGAGNVIAFQRIDGVLVRSGDVTTTPFNNSIRGNVIRSTGFLGSDGIGINLDGSNFQNDLFVTVNDTGDVDGGPNHLQNFPVLESAHHSADQIAISGRLESRPSQTYQLDFYSNSLMNDIGYGDGETYLGTIEVHTDAAGHAAFSAGFPADVPDGYFITATATNSDNNTSEFSERIQVGDVLSERFVVNTVSDWDDGRCDAIHCSLREAIHAANNHAGRDLIAFNIAGDGVQTIYVYQTLPTITDPLTIDGYTQPGSRPNTLPDGDNASLMIELASVNVSVGLNIRAGESLVRGLNLHGFAAGSIFVQENGGNTIEGNYLGTDVTGSAASSGGVTIYASSHNLIGGVTPQARNVISGFGGVVINGLCGAPSDPKVQFYLTQGNLVQGNYIGTDHTGAVALGGGGVSVACAVNNTIGGTTAAERNVISGNSGTGVSLGGNDGVAGNNRLLGNYIGTDWSGENPLGNDGFGVTLYASGDIVGGTEPGAGNVIASNRSGGIFITLTLFVPGVLQLSNHLVQGNLIGTDKDGFLPLGNLGDGVTVLTSSGNTIGGVTPGAGNVISGNGGNGLVFRSNGFSPFSPDIPSQQNFVIGNSIGAARDGATPLGNGLSGIALLGAAIDNRIGGSAPGEGNVVAFNGANGITASLSIYPSDPPSGTNRNPILGNSIHSNIGLGIDLGYDGVTPNDAGDFDGGPNNRQNYPVLTGFVSSGDNTTIQGTLNSRPNAVYRLEFFANTAADTSHFGEGEQFIGAASVTTDSTGNASFTVTLPVALAIDQVVSATATDAQGNTSEFSGRKLEESAGTSADLAVTSDDTPDPVFAGRILTYTTVISNRGPDVATGVTLIDTLPADVIFDSATASQGVCGAAGGHVLCSLGSIGDSSSATVAIRVVPTRATVVTNQVSVFSNQSDADTSNNTATAQTTVNPAADLAVTASFAPDPTFVGYVQSYTITVRNRGPSPAIGVELTDFLPAEVTYLFAQTTLGSCNLDVTTLTCVLGTLPKDAEAVVTIVVIPNIDGVLSNTAEVFSGTTELDESDNTATNEVTVLPIAELSLTMTANPDPVSVNQRLTYVLTAVNYGPSSASGVVVEDIIPAGVVLESVISSQGTCTAAIDSVSCTLGDIPFGEVVTIAVAVIPTQAGVLLLNSAHVVADTEDPAPFDNETILQTIVSAACPAALYGATTGEDESSILYAIDPATGVAAPVGPIGFERVSGMDFHPATGVLYATGERDGTSVLITIDPCTGAGAEIGPTQIRSIHFNNAVPDISFRSDGSLYAYLMRRMDLATIDIGTGIAAAVGATHAGGSSGNGMAFSADGTLYHTDGLHLNALNPVTGLATPLAALVFPPPANVFPRINAMDFDPATGTLFASLNDDFGGGNFLATINVATGSVTIIGPTVPGLDAMAFFVAPPGANHPPQANADAATTNQGDGVSQNVLANDSDVDGDTLLLTAFDGTTAHGGTVVCSQSGDCTIAPATGFVGSDTFAYIVSDSHGATSTATVTITVLNVAPMITSVTSNGPIRQGSSATVTVSATDPGGANDPLLYEFDCQSDGDFEIGPQASNFALCTFPDDGSFTVNVRVHDSHGAADAGAVTVVVNPAIELRSFDVQHGARQRSFVRTVDLVFDDEAALRELLDAGRIQLTRFDLNGNNGSTVSLSGRMTQRGSALEIDFGVQGIGGNRNSNAGDGYYQFRLDTDKDGVFETTRSFYRLFGDINGDRIVNDLDVGAVRAATGHSGDNLAEDTNGDGVVNALDLQYATRAVGRRIRGDLTLDD